MKKNLLVVLLVAVIFAGCIVKKEEAPAGIDSFYGVWAGRDCELIRTEKFELLFVRSGDTLSATLTSLDSKDNTLGFNVRGVVIFDSIKKQVTYKAKDLWAGEELLIDNDSVGTIVLSRREGTVIRAVNRVAVRSGGEIVEEVLPLEGKMKLRTPDGHRYQLELIEKISIVDPYDMRMVTKNEIGLCLQEWQLGTRLLKSGDEHVTGLLINTNKHAYVFSYGGMIYCRAARIRSDNNGTVFAQNIRMMAKTGEFTAAMDSDNVAIAKKEIVISDSLFNPSVCIYATEGIYWSLKSFEPNLIILNGCGGEDYRYERLDRSSPDILEWFAYRDYTPTQ